jgi:hypothetical protein
MLPVGSAAAPVNDEKLKLDRGADAVPSDNVLEDVVERLGVIGSGGEADDGRRGGEEGGAADDCGGREEGEGGGGRGEEDCT